MEKKECPGCGKEFKGRSKYCSYKCALPAMSEAIKQLQEKSGPVYERWKEGIRKGIEGI